MLTIQYSVILFSKLLIPAISYTYIFYLELVNITIYFTEFFFCLLNFDPSNKLSIFYLDFEELAKGTHLEGFYTSEALAMSYNYKYTHIADALR